MRPRLQLWMTMKEALHKMCQDELPPGLPGIKRKQPQKLTVSKITKTITENSHIQHCKQSYIYNFSGQKLIKIGKNNPFWRVFENLKLTVKQGYQTTQFIEKCQNSKIEMRHFGSFSNNVICLNETFSTMLNHCAKVLEKRSGLPYLTEEKYLHFM